jgi:serine/threonine protein kinase
LSHADFWVGPFPDPDRYRLVSLLGGGGEGEVWDAVLPLSAAGRSTVAVKVLPARPGDEQEFDHFGRLLRMLHHPGLVRVTEVFTGPAMHRGGTADGRTRANYVVMDLVEGSTLREWCDENPDASAAARLKMLRTVASALDEMHSGSVTHVPVAHGDVKPANVVVRPDGGTVLVDLGLARLADGVGGHGRSAPYAAPELRGDHPVTGPEADRFAFAVTTAQVLTGAPVPTGPDGWLDLRTLAELLHRSPVTARRPMLVQHVLDAIAAPPEARPRGLRVWLDSAAETLSQVTTGGGMPLPAPAGMRSAGAAGAAAAATLPVTRQPSEPSQVAPRKRRSRFPLIAAVALVLVIGLAVGASYLTSRPGDGQTAAGPPPTTAPAAATPAAVAPTTASSRSALPASARYLSDLTPVERDNHTGDNGGVSTVSATISGQQYGHAITLSAFCTTRDGGDFWADYDLARSWSRFTATIGIDDRSRSSSTATYTILADNVPIARGSLAFGRAEPIDLPVSGVLRLRIQINDPYATTPSCTYNAWAKVAWGDPKLTP